MEEILNRLIDLVQQTAPELWRIAQQRVLANTIETGIWCIIGFILFIPSIILFGRSLKFVLHNDYVGDSAVMRLFFGVIVSMFTGLVFFTNLSLLINLAVSPDYYAIQTLLGLVK